MLCKQSQSLRLTSVAAQRQSCTATWQPLYSCAAVPRRYSDREHELFGSTPVSHENASRIVAESPARSARERPRTCSDDLRTAHHIHRECDRWPVATGEYSI